MMQIDLQEPMKITSVEANGKSLNFNREGNAYFIELKQKQKKNDINYIKINYEGFQKKLLEHHGMEVFHGRTRMEIILLQHPVKD